MEEGNSENGPRKESNREGAKNAKKSQTSTRKRGTKGKTPNFGNGLSALFLSFVWGAWPFSHFHGISLDLRRKGKENPCVLFLSLSLAFFAPSRFNLFLSVPRLPPCLPFLFSPGLAFLRVLCVFAVRFFSSLLWSCFS